MPQYLNLVPCDLSLITIPVANYCMLSDVNISQGSVTTCLRCGGIFSHHFAANLFWV